MTTIISAIIAAAIAILLAAVVSASIKFEGGSNPKDPAKRRIVFFPVIPKLFNFIIKVKLFR